MEPKDFEEYVKRYRALTELGPVSVSLGEIEEHRHDITSNTYPREYHTIKWQAKWEGVQINGAPVTYTDSLRCSGVFTDYSTIPLSYFVSHFYNLAETLEVEAKGKTWVLRANGTWIEKKE